MIQEAFQENLASIQMRYTLSLIGLSLIYSKGNYMFDAKQSRKATRSTCFSIRNNDFVYLEKRDSEDIWKMSSLEAIGKDDSSVNFLQSWRQDRFIVDLQLFI